MIDDGQEHSLARHALSLRGALAPPRAIVYSSAQLVSAGCWR